MSKQHINLRLAGAEHLAATPDLAVEVYDADLTLAARGTLGSGVELEPDRDYIISATLPNGSRISKYAKLGPSETNVELKVSGLRQTAPPAAEMQADEPPASPRLETFSVGSLARAVIPGALRAIRGPAAPVSERPSPNWRALGFRGNLLSEGPNPFEL